MSQLTAKICVLGDFAVGKTSTVARFVHDQFSDKYLTTIGVKIDTRELCIDQTAIKFVVWDVAGTDKLKTVEMSYLKGASGYVLVCDGTRGDTLGAALGLAEQARARFGQVPQVVLANKRDLATQWEIKHSALAAVAESGTPVFETSAKTGENVDGAIETLARQIIQQAYTSAAT